MMIQMVDKSNTTPIGQDRETLTFKALLYLNVAFHAQVCSLFGLVYTAVSRKVVQQNRTRQCRKVLWVMGVYGI